MDNSFPKFSIITVCFNAEDFIERAIKSVEAQTYKNFEYIVVDGQSEDKTIEKVSTYPIVSKIISARDNGIYHAMNRALGFARGEVVYILNADDQLYDENVLEVV
ncbi:MAG: glycosyltransferase, partial [Candidatus Omnitrophica bacterium]|nr:glycosyltransferase [Candidatus Omnitrophota bacterium]